MSTELQKAAQLPETFRRPLPTVEELYEAVLQGKAEKLNDWERLLNQPPRSEWLVKHPLFKKEITDPATGQKVDVPIDYLPIEKVEFLAIYLFPQRRTEIKEVKLIMNSVVVTVRVHVLNPVTNEWEFQDGVGAAPIRTKSKAAAMDAMSVIDSGVQTAAPAAKTYAEKDAYEKFGRIFGRDLNRENLTGYGVLEKRFVKDHEPVEEELKQIIAMKETTEELVSLWNGNPELHGNKNFFNLINERKEQIKGGADGK